jgi:hypothetical protein
LDGILGAVVFLYREAFGIYGRVHDYREADEQNGQHERGEYQQLTAVVFRGSVATPPRNHGWRLAVGSLLVIDRLLETIASPASVISRRE